MKIDIDSVLSDMKRLLLTLADFRPAVAQAVNGYIGDAKERLSNLAEGALSGQLSYPFVIARLKEEPTNVKNQIFSIGEIIAADVEETVNRAVDIFENALKDVIPAS